MTHMSESILRQFAREKSVIITKGHGPCPVFARGDQRTRITHWLSRGSVNALEAEGILQAAPRGLTLSDDTRKRLLG